MLAVPAPLGAVHAASEDIDFDNQLCLSAWYRSQEIDIFGEISGVCFSPQADKFFVGIADATYSSLLQFNRHAYQSLLGGL